MDINSQIFYEFILFSGIRAIIAYMDMPYFLYKNTLSLLLLLCNFKFRARTIFRHSGPHIIFMLPKSKEGKHKLSINNTQYNP